jgi:leucyl aminopeptidase
MDTILRKALRKPTAADTVYLVKAGADLKNIKLSKDEVEFVKREHRAKHNIVEINRYKNRIFIAYGDFSGTKASRLEAFRKQGNDAQVLLNKARIERVVISAINAEPEETLAFTEGLLLANYQFLKYKKDADKKEHKLEEVDVYAADVNEEEIEELRIIVEAVYNARDMVNEPVSFLTAMQFAEEIKALGKQSKAKVEVFNKKKIETLKMGGLLAVNKGSIDPPTFSVMEWKPKNKVNKKPYVFVGKGVVYDTGGLSLKPSNFMDTMKCDMAGGAAVSAALYAIARAELPVWVVALIPATDNRPDGNAYTPGDVITMHDGSTVEVLNTDAEGRMILADALSYAQKYKPEMVLDLATLTGAAARAIGKHGIVAMRNDDFKIKTLNESSLQVYERLVEFPMWNEYDEEIKSNIADIKNLGGAEGGAITAGKFLQNFVDYPWIHLDIAGPSILNAKDSYRSKGGSGVGTRLLFEFIQQLS